MPEDRRGSTSTIRAVADVVSAQGTKQAKSPAFWGWAAAATTAAVSAYSKYADGQIILAQEDFKLKLLEQVGQCLSQ